MRAYLPFKHASRRQHGCSDSWARNRLLPATQTKPYLAILHVLAISITSLHPVNVWAAWLACTSFTFSSNGNPQVITCKARNMARLSSVNPHKAATSKVPSLSFHGCLQLKA